MDRQRKAGHKHAHYHRVNTKHLNGHNAKKNSHDPSKENTPSSLKTDSEEIKSNLDEEEKIIGNGNS